jgi:hypothetical protein
MQPGWDKLYQKIYYHIDTNQDVWLNMDRTGLTYRVGGPFASASAAEVDWIDAGFATTDPLWDNYIRMEESQSVQGQQEISSESADAGNNKEDSGRQGKSSSKEENYI